VANLHHFSLKTVSHGNRHILV